MAVSSPPTPLQKSFSDWEEAYRNRAYTLARMEMLTATEQSPGAPEAWFLLGLTELAARDFTRARASLARAQELLQKRAAVTLPHREFDALKKAVPLLLKGLDGKKLSSAPADWRIWLREPELIGSMAAALADKAHQPLGRSTPLMPLDGTQRIGAAGKALTGGILAPQLKIEKLKVDTMRDLLGRDADLRIQRDRIRIQEKIVIQRDFAPGAKSVESSTAGPEAYRPGQYGGTGSPTKPVPTPQGAAVVPYALPAPEAPRVKQPRSPAPPRELYPFTPAKPARPAPPPQPAAAAAAAPQTDAWAKWEQDVRDLVERGRDKEAMSRVEEAIARYPDSSRLLEVRAELLQQLGRRHEAAKAYATTYSKALRAGATDRADRSFLNAVELAKENGDLLLDLAGLAAAFGSVGMATTAGKLAMDLYRRRNDRPKLAQAMHKVLALDPGNQTLKDELARLENELQVRSVGKVQQTLSQHPQAQQELAKLGQMLETLAGSKEENEFSDTGVGTDESARPYERTRPPSTQQQRHDVAAQSRTDAEEMRRRALRAQMNRPADPASALGNKAHPGSWIMIASIITLFLSIMSPIPAMIGFFVSHVYVIGKSRAGEKDAALVGKVARVVFVVGVGISILSRFGR